MCLYGKSVSRKNIPLKVSKEEAILTCCRILSSQKTVDSNMEKQARCQTAESVLKGNPFILSRVQHRVGLTSNMADDLPIT